MMFPSSAGNVGDFGDKFRKAREKKELSFDDVSNVTKISSRMLQAIEEEHFDQLPGGVFNKGFIRAYAKHLGLDSEEAVTDYLECLRQAQVNAHEVWDPQPQIQQRAAAPAKSPKAAHAVEPTKSANKTQPAAEAEELPELQLPRAEHVARGRKDLSLNSSREIPWGIVAVAALVFVIGAILWIRHVRSNNPTAGSTSSNTVLAQTAKDPAAKDQSTQQNAQPQNTTPQSASMAAPPPDAASAPAAAAKSSAPDVDTDYKNDVTVRTFPKSNPQQPSAKAAAPLKLTIRATETSWISVQADGQIVSQETLIAPAHTSVSASREIVARIGNAAGVTFLWNGQEIPAEGAEAEVKTFIFDAQGMRALPSSTTPAPTQNQ